MSLHELLDVAFRWAHLIAGILWIGNSMLFNWLDRNLEQDGSPGGPRTRLSQGRIWLVHSGAFYEVEKKLLEPGQMPARLHWFKWQNGITWLTGIALLIVVYYMGGAAFLVDPAVRALSPPAAIATSAGSLVLGWVAYDLVWTLLERRPATAAVLSFALLLGAAFAFTQLFSGRGAYIQTGVLIGTVMTGNVWVRILPSQRALIAATVTGQDQDPRLSQRAKQRSIHNNYLTFPLLFIMVSNHFPSAFHHHLNWVVLLIVMLGGAAVRHAMNVRYAGRRWLAPALAAGFLTLGGVMVVTRIDAPHVPPFAGHVPFARAQQIIVERCIGCHSATPTDAIFTVAQGGVMFDTPAQIGAKADRIYERAIRQMSMPFQNSTGMTMQERSELAKWIATGARLE